MFPLISMLNASKFMRSSNAAKHDALLKFKFLDSCNAALQFNQTFALEAQKKLYVIES